MDAFVLSSIALSIGTCAIGLAIARLPRLSAATRHWIVSAALLTPLIAIGFALADPPNPFARGGKNARIETSIDQLQLDANAARSRNTSTLFLSVWATGAAIFLGFTARSIARWTKVARRAQPFTHDAFASRARVRLAISPDASEPMVVGVIRPTVLLPVGYLDSLDASEVESVFAHELEHVRRRDNATALLHEIVCALFWFDPLHWIARRRLLDLRERACDERVLELGCAPSSYIAALAKSCHAAIDSPAVACMSGFHVRERMDSIMSYTSNRGRFLSSRLVRWSAFTAALAITATFAFLAPAPPAFAQGEAKSASAHAREPISLDLKDADLRDVLRTFSQLTGRTITADPSINGKVTMSVTGMPWDEALQRAVAPLGLRAIEKSDGSIEVMPRFNGHASYRVGGDIKAPTLISRVDPVYTAEARAAGIAGIVILETNIDETGHVTDARVLKALPEGLDQAAIDAVKQWTFRPATLDDKPVPVIFTLTVNFRLE
jgi:TonB family protein